MFPSSHKQIFSVFLMAMSGMPNETHKPLVTLILLMKTSSYVCFTVQWPYHSTHKLCYCYHHDVGQLSCAGLCYQITWPGEPTT